MSYFEFRINYDVVKLLIQRGCKTNITDSKGKTFLHCPVKYSRNCNEIKQIINMIELSNLQKNDLLLKYYFINNYKTSFRNNLNNNLYQSHHPLILTTNMKNMMKTLMIMTMKILRVVMKISVM